MSYWEIIELFSELVSKLLSDWGIGRVSYWEWVSYCVGELLNECDIDWVNYWVSIEVFSELLSELLSEFLRDEY